MIGILEDDGSIRELVVYTLTSAGFDAAGYARPSELWAALRAKQVPELLLLDIMLPEEDGLSVLRRLRAEEQTRRLPVMMLTAKDAEFDKVLGLDAGADDYLPKPFGMMELLARVRALLRRAGQAETPEAPVYTLGALSLDPGRHVVKVDGAPVQLTYKEFELLALLLSHRGLVFSRNQLMDQIWGYTAEVESRTVDVHIRTLRAKLGAAGNLIETVRGVGYKISEDAI